MWTIFLKQNRRRNHQANLNHRLHGSLYADRVLFSVGVGAVRGNDVADPTERAARTEPESRGENQPQYSRQNAAVVELANARNNQTQDSRQNWIAHRIKLPPQWNLIRQPRAFCSFSARRRDARRQSRHGTSSASSGRRGYTLPFRGADVSPAALRLRGCGALLQPLNLSRRCARPSLCR